jgi:protein phosphatase 2C family protein 2/3
MQGWRSEMEDVHTAILDLQNTNEPKKTTLEERLSFFSVFDGHGGHVTSRFCGKNLYKILAKQPAFRIGDYEKALKDSFLATDEALMDSFLDPAILEAGIHYFSRRMDVWLLAVTSARYQL